MKVSKHDKYVDDLLDKISVWGFDSLEAYVKDNGYEYDIIGKKDDVIYYFEVKSSKKGRKKAIQQIGKWADKNKHKPKHAFVYIGKDDELQMVR